jgi:predicted ATP-dependent endonuclease of OLD family
MQINSSEDQLLHSPTELPDRNFYVIVGGNNSGKTTFLREIVKTFPEASYRIDVNRTLLKGEGAQDKGYIDATTNRLSRSRGRNDDNTEREIQTLQDLFFLKDKERTPIIEWYNHYFPNHIYEEREDPDNSASSMLLKVNGYSITKQGSGMRATLEIFIKLFDPLIKVLCIDEPELGLEPYLQKYLFEAIKDKSGQNKKIFLATHSHHFLDLDTIENNFICERDNNNKIFLTQVTDLQAVIFRLLGNTLSSFLLPERIVILEGPSDTTFLNRALSLLNKTGYAIHNSRGSGNVTYALNAITQFLRFNQDQLPVYADRLHVIVDRPGRDILVREWERRVPHPQNQICTLANNGIEYYYPERLLQQIFNTGDSRQHIVDGYLASRNNSFNGINISKTELSKLVANGLTAEDLADGGNQLFQFLNSLP